MQEEIIFKEDNRINLLAERDKRIKEQEQALQTLNQERLKNILFRDIRKYNSKKPKKSEQAYKFAKRLKGMEINKLKELLSEKQQKKEVVQAYFKAMGASNAAFDDKSMEEEDL